VGQQKEPAYLTGSFLFWISTFVGQQTINRKHAYIDWMRFFVLIVTETILKQFWVLSSIIQLTVLAKPINQTVSVSCFPFILGSGSVGFWIYFGL